MALWSATPPAGAKVRWEYPVVWRGDTGLLRFLAVVSTANEPKGLAFNDWITLHGATWEALGRWDRIGDSPPRWPVVSQPERTYRTRIVLTA